jgi:hypothetical protein
MANGCPPNRRTMARAARTALGSPSIANDTPASDGREPRTNVIRGCTEATAAPRFCSLTSSSPVSAPLECSATLPCQSAAAVRDAAAPAIAPSGTQNQTISARMRTRTAVTAAAPTSRANRRACRKDATGLRETIWSIRYPAPRSAGASAPARFPTPTIVITGFVDCVAGMPGRIAECRKPNPESRALYCCHAQASTLQDKAGSVR